MTQNPGGSSGQVLLMTLLALAIATTIGLALLGRSTTDVSISNRIEESARAFSAAEAGIEVALARGTSGSAVLSPGVSYNATVNDIGGTAGVYQFPAKTTRGSVDTLWLAPYDPATGTFDETIPFGGSSVDLCWSQEAIVPAIVVSVVYHEAGVYKTQRSAFDASSRSNYFTPVGPAGNFCGQQTSVYHQNIALPPSGVSLMMRIQPVYGNTQLFIDPLGQTLPLQGTRIESVGTTNTGLTRRIVALQEFRSPPSIFDSVIYTPGSFIQ